MKKVEKIYKIASVINFVLHILLFVFIVIVSFLPFREDKNFYQAFTGFFGPVFSTSHPYFILLILLLACICSFFVIKRPKLSIIVAILTLSFFVIVTFPYVLESAMVSFVSMVGEADMSVYHIGFNCMNIASCVVYYEFAFVIYSYVTSIIRNRK